MSTRVTGRFPRSEFAATAERSRVASDCPAYSGDANGYNEWHDGCAGVNGAATV